ncbi:MAG: serine/threonine protein kinase [Gemmataceae bacterium]|nr:serine/threonine protein kinase [Gemmataceae bacterium]
MSETLACPDHSALRRALDGGAPEEVERLAAHIEGCAACRSALGPLLPEMRARRSGPRPHDAPTVVGVPPGAEAVDLSFLRPARGPGEVGRLGAYRLLGILGQGGMGLVFQAEDTQLGRQAALKTMLPGVARNPKNKERFFREARAAAALEHPRIVPIYQVGEDNGIPFLAMPLLRGETLDDRLRREKRLPVAEAVRIAAEMAEGLEAAHAAGLVHRDIKPGNVWLEGPEGRAKLLDFGLARMEGDGTELTRSGVIVGTPAFMAPEQAKGGKVDHRADLFGLGCTLYVMLTGRTPFKGDDTMSLLAALALDKPTPPRALVPEVPAALSGLVMDLLGKKPEWRPASASAVLAALRCPLDRAPGRSARGWLAAALLLLALSVAGFFLARQGNPASEADDPGPKPPVVPAVVEEPAKKDRPKPFILRRKGGEDQEFKTLAGTLDVIRDGDTVEIHGNGPYHLGKLSLAGQKLELKAAPGYRPRFLPHEGVWANDPFHWITLKDAALAVQGCDFDGGPPVAKGAPLFLLGKGGAICFLRKCRVMNMPNFCHFDGPALEVSDSLIASVHPAHIGARCAVLCRNSIVACPFGGLELAAPGGQKVRLENCTFWTSRVVALVLGAQDVEVVAKGNVFDFRTAPRMRALPVDRREGLDASDWRGHLRWQGERNLYRGLGPDTNRAAPAWWPKEPSALAAWNRFLPKAEEGSREDARPVPWTLDGIGSLAEARKRSGIADLGPGPGPDDSREKPAPEAGGPLVLLRAGEVVAGFKSLASALEQAKDGDTVEARSDAAFDSWALPAGFGSLTVRAGAGWRPGCGTVVVHAGSALAVEGFRLAGLRTLDGAAGEHGRISRLADCRIEAEEEVAATMGTRDGKAAEIVRCGIRGPQAFGLFGGTRAEARDCVFAGCEWRVEGAGKAGLSFDRCLLRNLRWANSTVLSIRAEKGDIEVSSRRTLFDSSGLLLAIWSGRPLRWEGERNLYRLPFGYGGNGGANSLATWRAYAGAKEAGSAEGDALLCDPRAWAQPEKGYGAKVSEVAP